MSRCPYQPAVASGHAPMSRGRAASQRDIMTGDPGNPVLQHPMSA